MKIFTTLGIGLFLFLAVTPDAGSPALGSRRTIRELAIREHWRVKPFAGYQGHQRFHLPTDTTSN